MQGVRGYIASVLVHCSSHGPCRGICRNGHSWWRSCSWSYPPCGSHTASNPQITKPIVSSLTSSLPLLCPCRIHPDIVRLTYRTATSAIVHDLVRFVRRVNARADPLVNAIPFTMYKSGCYLSMFVPLAVSKRLPPWTNATISVQMPF